MKLELKPVLGYGLGATAHLLQEGFSDYVVPVSLDEEALRNWVQHDGMDLSSSVVLSLGGRGVGVALIQRRERASRLAAMALIPEVRGQGLGGQTMAHLMDRARTRGDRTMELEVIVGNEPAISLYQRCGFRTMRRLLSFVLSEAGDQDQAGTGLEPVELGEMARLVLAHGLPDLPWQVSGQALARLGPPNETLCLGSAYVTITNPEAEGVYIRSILVEPRARRQGQAGQVLRALLAAFPGKSWHISPLCPEELAGLFEKAGFAPDTLSQFQMRAKLQ